MLLPAKSAVGRASARTASRNIFFICTFLLGVYFARVNRKTRGWHLIGGEQLRRRHQQCTPSSKEGLAGKPQSQRGLEDFFQPQLDLEVKIYAQENKMLARVQSVGPFAICWRSLVGRDFLRWQV